MAADHGSPTGCHASVSTIVAGNIAFPVRHAATVGQRGASAVEMTGRGQVQYASGCVQLERLNRSLRALDHHFGSGGGWR